MTDLNQPEDRAADTSPRNPKRLTDDPFFTLPASAQSRPKPRGSSHPAQEQLDPSWPAQIKKLTSDPFFTLPASAQSRPKPRETSHPAQEQLDPSWPAQIKKLTG